MSRTKKILRRTYRTIIALLLLFVLLIGGIFVFINSDPGEKWLAGQLSSMLEKQAGIKVDIGHLDVQLPNTLLLDSVVVHDQHGATMFYLEHVKGQIGFYDIIHNKLIIQQAILDGVDFNLLRYKGERTSNLGFVIDSLSAPNGAHSANPFKMAFQFIKISNLNFRWDDSNQPADTTPGIDWDHVRVTGMNGQFTDLNIDGDNVSANVRRLNLFEKSGFRLTDLKTSFAYTDESMEFDHLLLETPYTKITNYLKFDYTDVGNFDDFIDSVDMNANFLDTKVSFKDIAFFTPELHNKQDSVMLHSAVADGTVAKLDVRNLYAEFGDRSYITGKVSLKGLPYIDETFIDAHLKSARTSRQELYRLFPELELPEEIDRFGIVSLKGDFTGFITDFVTYGTFETELGSIKTDLNLKLAKNPAQSTYSGKLELENFDLGKLVRSDMLGITTMKGTLVGQGFDLDNLKANLQSSFQRFDFNGYSYQNLNVDGTFRNKFFNGSLSANDPNVKLEFRGAIDFAEKKPAFDFIANVDKANLLPLHFSKDTLSISSLLNIDARGSNADNLEGKINAYNTSISTGSKNYHLDSLFVTSTITSDSSREINISSELLNAKLKGNFIPTQLPELAKTIINRYLDSSFVQLKTKAIPKQNVDFNIQFIDLAPLFAVLGEDMAISDSGYLRGSINNSDDLLLLDASLPYFRYKQYKAEDLRIRGRGYEKSLSLGVTAGSFYYKDTMLMRNLNIKSRSDNKELLFDVTAEDQPRLKKVNLTGTLDIIGKTAYLNLDTSELKVRDTTWKVAARTITFYGDTMIDFPLVSFMYGDQTLKLIGKYSSTHSYPIRAIMENMSLRTFTAFAPEFRDFNGNVNGQVLINNINEKPIVEAAVFANPFIYGEDTLGFVSATANFDQSTNKLSVDASLENDKQEQVITANGDVDFSQGQKLAINLNLNQTELKIFQPVVSEVFSDLAGTASAQLRIEGTVEHPELHGKAQIRNAALTVDYLKTHYTFEKDIDLDGKVINIKDLMLQDVNKHTAMLNGSIDLRDISNIGLNLNIRANDLLVLNTTQKDNDLFYGTGYGTGYVNINGHLDNLRMYVKMKTEPNTVFSLPVTQGSSFSGYDYIHFTTSEKYLKETKKVSLSGLALSMDLEVTPDALAQIIFDPRVGDILEARGSSNLRMDISTEGDFNMYGTYTLSEGNYRFTAFDVINKSFDIKQGSTITWQGNPYEAGLNVKAAYSLRTSLKPLLPPTASDKDAEYYSRNYPVEAQLFLTGLLFSPDVKLDFEVQELNSMGGANLSVAQTQIRNIKSNDQELTKQVVSLLVFNQFVPVNEGIGFGEGLSSGISSGVGDLVSNQLNYWLSRFTNDIQVGIDYHKQEEFTLRVSKDFNKERANVSFAYDFTNNNYNAQGSYKLKKDGNTQLKVFSRSNNNILFNQNSNTIGVGIFIRKEFNSFSDLFKRKSKEAKKEEKQGQPDNGQDPSPDGLGGGI